MRPLWDACTRVKTPQQHRSEDTNRNHPSNGHLRTDARRPDIAAVAASKTGTAQAAPKSGSTVQCKSTFRLLQKSRQQHKLNLSSVQHLRRSRYRCHDAYLRRLLNTRWSMGREEMYFMLHLVGPLGYSVPGCPSSVASTQNATSPASQVV